VQSTHACPPKPHCVGLVPAAAPLGVQQPLVGGQLTAVPPELELPLEPPLPDPVPPELELPLELPLLDAVPPELAPLPPLELPVLPPSPVPPAPPSGPSEAARPPQFASQAKATRAMSAKARACDRFMRHPFVEIGPFRHLSISKSGKEFS